MTGVRQSGHDVSLCARGFTWHSDCRLPIDYRPASTGYQVLENQALDVAVNPPFTSTLSFVSKFLFHFYS